MDMTSSAGTLIIFGGALFLSYYWLTARKKSNVIYIEGGPPLKLPPCVATIPVFGSLPFLPPFPKMYKYFTRNIDKYKDVVAYYLMDKYRVVLNSREAIHEAFVKRATDFADRPTSPVNELLNPNQKGILFHPYNDNFKKYHKLSLTIMKQFGFGNRIMEKRIMEEVEALLNKISKFEGKEFNPSPILANCSMNIICGMLFGKRFDDNDPHLSDTILNIRASFNNLAKVFIINLFPIFTYFSFYKRALNNSVEAQKKVFDMLEEKIIECTEGINAEIQVEGAAKESFIRTYVELEGPEYDKEQLLHFMHELFLAGTETTASTLEWTLIYLANHVEVQEKMFSELQILFPEDELPSLEQKKNMVYCEAVFFEILRIKTVAPLTLPHVTMRDTHVMGYYLPAGTYVIGNLHGVHHNPEVWKNPEEFIPERFLDEKKEEVINKDLIASFSFGKRSCFGEILARQEVFLSMTSIVKRFIILPPVGLSKLVVEDMMDVTVKPSFFTVRLVEREAK